MALYSKCLFASVCLQAYQKNFKIQDFINVYMQNNMSSLGDKCAPPHISVFLSVVSNLLKKSKNFPVHLLCLLFILCFFIGFFNVVYYNPSECSFFSSDVETTCSNFVLFSHQCFFGDSIIL